MVESCLLGQRPSQAQPPLLMETSEDLGDQSLDCVFSYRLSSLVARFHSALATADWSWALVHRGTPNPHNFLGVWLVVILPCDGIQCIPAFSDPDTGSTLHCTNGNSGSEAAFLLSNCFQTPLVSCGNPQLWSPSHDLEIPRAFPKTLQWLGSNW